jgi:hypothetical protein
MKLLRHILYFFTAYEDIAGVYSQDILRLLFIGLNLCFLVGKWVEINETLVSISLALTLSW